MSKKRGATQETFDDERERFKPGNWVSDMPRTRKKRRSGGKKGPFETSDETVVRCIPTGKTKKAHHLSQIFADEGELEKSGRGGEGVGRQIGIRRLRISGMSFT